jgi:uncharacterized membrane protein YebE (DUF533 family)
MNPNVASLIRHGLSAAGGFLIAKGVVTLDQVNEVVGAIIALAGVGWSVFKNKKTDKKAP